jgi:hypothetical protein
MPCVSGSVQIALDKLLDDLLWRVVLLDLALKVEADHVARVDELVRQFEKLGQTLLFCLLYVLRRHINDEVHVDIVVVFLIVLLGTQHLSSNGGYPI